MRKTLLFLLFIIGLYCRGADEPSSAGHILLAGDHEGRPYNASVLRTNVTSGDHNAAIQRAQSKLAWRLPSESRVDEVKGTPLQRSTGDSICKPVKGKIVTNAQMIGVGSTNILDTYLSPEKYRGTEIRYISHTVRERVGARATTVDAVGAYPCGRPHNRPTTTLIHQGYLSFSDNRAGEGGAIAGMYSFSYALHWQLIGGRRGAGDHKGTPLQSSVSPDGLTLTIGAQADANLGFLYNTRNGNNPAQARASINIGPSAAAGYRLHIGRREVTIGYELSVPLLGVMFSPNYGQSYYEIFNEGNYDRNIVPTTIGCAPSLRQMLTVDLHLKSSSLRIGYYGDIEQYKVNNLKYHNYSHIFMIGYVKRFKSIKLKP